MLPPLAFGDGEPPAVRERSSRPERWLRSEAVVRGAFNLAAGLGRVNEVRSQAIRLQQLPEFERNPEIEMPAAVVS